MKCPKCESENQVSKLYPQGSYETLAGTHSYYDEEGKYHSHNSNKTTSIYVCSNRHQFRIDRINKSFCCDSIQEHNHITILEDAIGGIIISC